MTKGGMSRVMRDRPPDDRALADPAELVVGGAAPEDGVVAHGHVAGDQDRVGDDDVVADDGVVATCEQAMSRQFDAHDGVAALLGRRG
jgi:hypothetical protein